MTGWKRLALALAVCGFLLSGCGDQEGAVSEVEEQFGADTVVLGAYRHQAPGERDAYYISKSLGVWEPLITHDGDGRPRGVLATDWEMQDNGRVWIFHLRKGVVFHNGTPFDANAVLKNFDRWKKGYKRSTFYGLDINTYYPSLKTYEKLDDYTIKLTFEEPNINELYKMMDFGSAIFAPECFAPDGNFDGFAIGTGPFKIVENNLNKYVVVERNEDYYGGVPEIKRFVVKNIPSPEARYSALRSEEIYGVMDLNAIPPFLAEEIRKDDRFAVNVNRSTMTRFLVTNGKKFPFNDVRMRKAVSLAIDRRDLVHALYLDYAEPAVNLLNYTSPYHKHFDVEYNPEKAKELARSVLGDQRVEVVYCINGSEPLQKGEAELIAYWLRDIGLDVKIMALEYATMSYVLRKGEYNIARLQNGLANGDPYSIFYTFMMPDGGRNISTSSGYRNDEVVQLMNEVLHVEDEAERRRIYDRIQEIAVEEHPTIPLFYDVNIVAFNKKLIDYNPLIYGVDLARVRWEGAE